MLGPAWLYPMLNVKLIHGKMVVIYGKQRTNTFHAFFLPISVINITKLGLIEFGLKLLNFCAKVRAHTFDSCPNIYRNIGTGQFDGNVASLGFIGRTLSFPQWSLMSEGWFL